MKEGISALDTRRASYDLVSFSGLAESRCDGICLFSADRDRGDHRIFYDLILFQEANPEGVWLVPGSLTRKMNQTTRI